jgi:hypothetical protein
MSGRVYLLGVGLVLVALAFIVTDRALPPTPGVTEVNVKRVKVGMTYGEVEDLLGSPDLIARMNGGLRSSRNQMEADIRDSDAVRAANGGFVVWPWDGEEGTAVVYFGPDARAHKVTWMGADPPQGQSFFARLRAWLGW